MSETTDDGFVPTNFVCKGYAYENGKMYVRIHRLSADFKPIGEGGLYEIDKNLRGMTCGGVYTIPATEKKIRAGQKVFLKWGGDVAALADEIDAWQIDSKAAETRKVIDAQEKKSAELSVAFHSMDKLRAIYRGTNYEGKLAIEVRLLDYLRRGIK